MKSSVSRTLSATRRWSDAAAKAVFQTVAHFESPPEDLMGLKRIPGNAGNPQSTGFSSERLNRSVACESCEERRVFAWLERSAAVRWYQEQPVAVPYIFDGRLGYYYPDAAVLDHTGRVVILEVKPRFMMFRQATLAKASAALAHFGPRGIGYLLVDSRGQTLSDLACVSYDMNVVETVESLFSHGPVPLRIVRNTMALWCGHFNLGAFASMVVNRDWGVTSGPGARVWKLPHDLSFRVLTARSSQ